MAAKWSISSSFICVVELSPFLIGSWSHYSLRPWSSHYSFESLVFMHLFYVTFVPFCGSFFFGRGAIDVAYTTNGLDSFQPIQLVAQLLAQIADVHVDAAIEG